MNKVLNLGFAMVILYSPIMAAEDPTAGVLSLGAAVRVGKGVRHPGVHSEIEVGHDKDRCLEPFSQIEGSPSKLEAF